MFFWFDFFDFLRKKKYFFDKNFLSLVWSDTIDLSF